MSKKENGFTLIELLVVLTLLALLLSIAVPRYLTSAENSRAKVREQNIATIRDALDKFNADQGHFPASLDELVSKHYLRRIPVDPVTETDSWVAVQDGPTPGIVDVTAPSEVQVPEPAATPTPLPADIQAIQSGPMPTPMPTGKAPQ